MNGCCVFLAPTLDPSLVRHPEIIPDVKVLKDYFHFVAVSSQVCYSGVTQGSQSALTAAARVRVISNEWARFRLPGFRGLIAYPCCAEDSE